MATEPITETSVIFGRLTWAALPLHDPILVATFAAVCVGGIAVVAALTWFRLWGYLWHEWFTSVDHKRIGIMYMVLGIDHAAARLRRCGDDAAAAGDGLRRLRGLPAARTTTTRSSPPTASIMIFFVAMPMITGLMNFVMPLQIGAPRRRLPLPQQFQLLDDGRRRGARHGLALRRRVRPDRLARLPAAVRSRRQPLRRSRLLHLGPADRGHRHDPVRHQPDRDDHQDARPGHDDDADAGLHLDRALLATS